MCTTRSKMDKGELKSIIKDTIVELFADKNFISTVTKSLHDKISETFEKLQKCVTKSEEKIQYLENEIEIMKQREKINNVCIYGIQEEKQEDLGIKIVNILNTHTNLSYTVADFSSHRIGIANNLTLTQAPKPRPVLVKFNISEDKGKLLRERKKFKGSKLFICDDLTKKRKQLLMDAKAALGKDKVWTVNGWVKAKVGNKIVKINNYEDIQNYT